MDKKKKDRKKEEKKEDRKKEREREREREGGRNTEGRERIQKVNVPKVWDLLPWESLSQEKFSRPLTNLEAK